jgi:hypothetical protein
MGLREDVYYLNIAEKYDHKTFLDIRDHGYYNLFKIFYNKYEIPKHLLSPKNGNIRLYGILKRFGLIDADQFLINEIIFNGHLNVLKQLINEYSHFVSTDDLDIAISTNQMAVYKFLYKLYISKNKISKFGASYLIHKVASNAKHDIIRRIIKDNNVKDIHIFDKDVITKLLSVPNSLPTIKILYTLGAIVPTNEVLQKENR